MAPGPACLGIVLAGAVAAGVVVTSTGPHGPGLSSDSGVYLSTADALAHGHGFRVYGGVPLTKWPPGYPLALAAWLEVFGGRAADAARAVNAASVFALVVLTGLVLRRYVGRGALMAAGVILVAFAPAVLHTGANAWSEMLFAACMMASLLFLARSLAGWRMLDVALAGCCASACIAVRFIGVGVALAGLLVLVVGGRWATHRAGLLARCLVFAGLAAVAPAAWLASRLTITASPLGVRNAPQMSWLENARDAVTSMSHWFVPETLSDPVRHVGYVVAASALCVGWGLWLRSRPPRTGAASSADLGKALWLPALVAGSVVAVTIVGASVTKVDPLDFRLLSPAFAPSVVFVIGATDRLLDSRPGRATACLAAMFLVGWVAAGVGADVRLWRDMREGEGYASAEWRSSELAGLIRRALPGGRLYSNKPAVVWLLTERASRRPTPPLGGGPGSVSVPADLRHDVQTPAWLVWFPGPEVRVVPRGPAGCQLSRVITVREGILFRVTGTACGTA